MRTFELTQYELHTSKLLIRASNLPEAIRKWQKSVRCEDPDDIVMVDNSVEYAGVAENHLTTIVEALARTDSKISMKDLVELTSHFMGGVHTKIPGLFSLEEVE